MIRCPVCGSSDVRGGTLALERPDDSPFVTVKLYDFFCHNCKTAESCRSDEPTFTTWYARWQGD